MPRTPLHDVIGESATELSFEMIQRACDLGVAERANLDWKEKLPLTATRDQPEAKQRQQSELAKDIAAMANSGGGMIVYGVAEATGRGSSADRIEPVGKIDEQALRDIRRVAGNHIYPPVTGLELIPLVPFGNDDEADQGVLVLLVPDSPERPHLVHHSRGHEWFAAPYRHGPDTEWMVERQIASAYLERESARRRRSSDFDDRFNAFTSTLDAGGSSLMRWAVAVAVPDTPLAHPQKALTLAKADRIINRAWTHPLAGEGLGPCELTRHEPTRQGLRRFIRTGRRDIQAAAPASARARIEVHNDGAVMVAATRDGAIHGEGHQATHVPVDDIEHAALDCFALLQRVHTELGVSGDYSARMTIHPPTQIFRRPDTGMRGSYMRWDEQRIYGYVPVDGPVLTSEGLEATLTTWLAITRDTLNQAGSQLTLDPDDLLTHIQVES